MNYWNWFLKKYGYIVVTCPSRLTDKHPAEVEMFGHTARSKLDTIKHNISVMQRAGYSFIDTFILFEKGWADNYFISRAIIEESLLKKYSRNKTVEDSIKNNEYEIELYSRYKQYYGHVFYIGKKV